MKIKLFLIALMALFAVSCKVTLVPQQSLVIKQELSTIKALTGNLMVDIKTATNKQYLNFDAKYQEIDVLYDSVIVQQNRRVKAKNLLTISTNCQSAFVSFQSYHKRKDTLADSEIDITKSQFDALINPLIWAEEKLK